MKESLNELLRQNPEPYSEWPVHVRRMFWCIVEHAIFRDADRAAELILLVKSWHDIDRDMVDAIIGYPEGIVS